MGSECLVFCLAKRVRVPFRCGRPERGKWYKKMIWPRFCCSRRFSSRGCIWANHSGKGHSEAISAKRKRKESCQKTMVFSLFLSYPSTKNGQMLLRKVMRQDQFADGWRQSLYKLIYGLFMKSCATEKTTRYLTNNNLCCKKPTRVQLQRLQWLPNIFCHHERSFVPIAPPLFRVDWVQASIVNSARIA